MGYFTHNLGVFHPIQLPEKTINVITEDNLPPGDQDNIAFMGTIVVSGRAKGVVVETGARTVLGEIAESVKEVTTAKTPMQERLEKFSKIVLHITEYCDILRHINEDIMLCNYYQ